MAALKAERREAHKKYEERQAQEEARQEQEDRERAPHILFRTVLEDWKDSTWFTEDKRETFRYVLHAQAQ